MSDKKKPVKEDRARRPEFRMPDDPIMEAGRRLRDRRDALQPHSDTKNWR